MNLLTGTRVFGIENIEDEILASLTTGDPALFYGPPGTGKTHFATSLAQLLGISEDEVHVYSCPTMNYEDVVGYPVPERNEKTGKFSLEFCPTPTTVWNKQMVVLDEINRTKYDQQNNMLQLIRDRKCVGITLPLKYIFACMNELTEKGTKPLDRALADRFTWFLPFPRYSKLSDRDKVRVIMNRSFQDRVLLGGFEETKKDERLIEFLEQSREEFKNCDFGIENFVKDVVDFCNAKKGFDIEGRRANMLNANLRAFFAVKRCKGGFDMRDEKMLVKALTYSMPHVVIDVTGVSVDVIKAAVNSAVDRLVDKRSPASKYYQLTDPVEMFTKLLNDKEIRNDKKVCSESIEYALTQAVKSDTAEDGNQQYRHGKRETAMSLYILCRPDIVSRQTFGRAVSPLVKLPDMGKSVGSWIKMGQIDKFLGNMINTACGSISQFNNSDDLFDATEPGMRIVGTLFFNDVVAHSVGARDKMNEVVEVTKQLRTQVRF